MVDEDALLSLGQAAKRLGVHVATVRRHIKAGRWAACRIGGCTKIPESVIRELLTPRKLKPSGSEEA